MALAADAGGDADVAVAAAATETRQPFTALSRLTPAITLARVLQVSEGNNYGSSDVGSYEYDYEDEEDYKEELRVPGNKSGSNMGARGSSHPTPLHPHREEKEGREKKRGVEEEEDVPPSPPFLEPPLHGTNIINMLKRTLLTYYSSSSNTDPSASIENLSQPKRPRAEFSHSDIIGDPGLHKPIEAYPPEIRDQVRRAYALSGPTQPDITIFPCK
ncbi:hypothetical protein OsJ_24042 [Oryza sativa Japonica Group]|uniref:Uncharacterized protein n=1 Tax=Oryza sativa subsp. japonica TaxID=39947 RepID=B9FWY5_ORYSJ|nr:hypothetical protein OsJ_24042 [Oryza sativa Japonica Group]